MTKDSPKNDIIDYPFDDMIKDLNQIDATFALATNIDPLNEHIVIIERLRYCSFRRIEKKYNLRYSL